MSVIPVKKTKYFSSTTSHADPNVSRLWAPFKDVEEEIDLQNKFTLI